MKRSDHENFNSETTGLEVPLPKGKMRLYRRDAKDGRLEFTGESAPHEKTVSDRAEWVVEVPAGGEAGVSYSVMYSWM